MSKYNMTISHIDMNDEQVPALVYFEVDKGLRITEIKVNGSIVEVDDTTNVRLKKEAMKYYFDNRALHAAIDRRKNPSLGVTTVHKI